MIFLFLINTAQKLIIPLIHSDNEAMINKGSRNRVENGRNCTIAINLAYAGRSLLYGSRKCGKKAVQAGGGR